MKFWLMHKHWPCGNPPDLDIDGIDTAHKAVLLASMAYGAAVPMKACPTSGIRGLSKVDISNADELGYRIKLLL